MSPVHATRWEAFLATHPAAYPAAQRAVLAELLRATGHDFVGELLEDLCRDGRERAREIAGAAAREDHTGVARGAHTLKSMGRALGFERLGRLCVRIEDAVAAGSLAAVRHDVAEIERELDHARRLLAAWVGEAVAA